MKHGIIGRIMHTEDEKSFIHTFVRNLEPDSSVQMATTGKIYMLTLCLLELLFQLDFEKYGGDFQKAGGVNALHDLLNWPAMEIQEQAHLMIEAYFSSTE